MRIALWIQALIAVLGLAATVDHVSSHEHTNETLHGSRIKRSPRKRHLHEGWYDPYYKHNISLSHAGELLNHKGHQELLRQEIKNRTSVDCCPSVLEMIEPTGGKNQEEKYVELYRDGDYRQRFYELSCHQDILQKPCRFMDKKLHNLSLCVQKYSYTYALVKDPGGRRSNNFPTFPASGPGGATWTLDYIRVRSGCSCVVTPNAKKKRNKKPKRVKVHDDFN